MDVDRRNARASMFINDRQQSLVRQSGMVTKFKRSARYISELIIESLVNVILDCHF